MTTLTPSADTFSEHASTADVTTRLGHAPVVSIRSTKTERLAKQGREAAIRMMAATDTDEVPAAEPGQPTADERIRFAVERIERVESGPAPDEFKAAYSETARAILAMVYGDGWETMLRAHGVGASA